MIWILWKAVLPCRYIRFYIMRIKVDNKFFDVRNKKILFLMITITQGSTVMSSFGLNLKNLLHSRCLTDLLVSLKKHTLYSKKSFGLTNICFTNHLQSLAYYLTFISNGLCINSILALAAFYKDQAIRLLDLSNIECGVTYQQIHLESGSVLVKRYDVCLRCFPYRY